MNNEQIKSGEKKPDLFVNFADLESGNTMAVQEKLEKAGLFQVNTLNNLFEKAITLNLPNIAQKAETLKKETEKKLTTFSKDIAAAGTQFVKEEVKPVSPAEQKQKEKLEALGRFTGKLQDIESAELKPLIKQLDSLFADLPVLHDRLKINELPIAEKIKANRALPVIKSLFDKPIIAIDKINAEMDTKLSAVEKSQVLPLLKTYNRLLFYQKLYKVYETMQLTEREISNAALSDTSLARKRTQKKQTNKDIKAMLNTPEYKTYLTELQQAA